MLLRLAMTDGSLWSKIGNVDYAGGLLFLFSATAVVLLITLAGTIYAWSSFRILLPLVLGAVGRVTFFFHQKMIARHPLIRISIFSNRTTRIGYAGTFADGLCFMDALGLPPTVLRRCLGIFTTQDWTCSVSRNLYGCTNIIAAIVIIKIIIKM